MVTDSGKLAAAAATKFLLLSLIVTIGAVAGAEELPPRTIHDVSSQANSNNSTNNDRTSRFFEWLGIGVGVVRFENAVCPAANGLIGICYTRRQCTVVGGYASGRCARNIGVCCVVQVGCGATSANNNTYFTNAGFPLPFSGGPACSLTVQRCNADICQVRIDFLSLILAQPNGDGVCVNDALVITGAASPVGRICGENTGQHVYLDFDDDEPIVLTIYTGTVSFARQWNIKVAQIGCDSPSRAPAGCLMYYGGLTGTVRSFNYGQTANPALPVAAPAGTIGSRQLANTNYGVCVRAAPGYCSIQWSPTATDPYAFTVSSDTVLDIATPPMTPLTGADCPTDFVVIPNGVYVSTLMSTLSDRYCGNLFLPVRTYSKPYVLTVVTNGDEAGDNANRGFSLSYTQERCGSNLLL